MTSIYVACLAAYNDGYLHGKWIDVENKGVEEIEGEIAEVLKASPAEGAEEWAIHDTEISWVEEYTRIPEIVEYFEIMKSSDFERELIEELKAYLGCGIKEAVDYANNYYYGAYESMLDFAYRYIEDVGLLDDVVEQIKRYFDYESFARDLSLDFLEVKVGNKLHVFINQ